MSKVIEIAAQVGSEKATTGIIVPAMKVNYTIPESTEEAIEMFGDDVVLSYFLADLAVALQSGMRGKMATIEEGEKVPTGIKPKKLQEFADEWKPGKKTRGRPAEERLAADIEKLTPEQKTALLKRMGIDA
ncbi:hypothetical protein CMI37_09020 [Candidatus Pacearchaeota archaeon]|nr:hypothetical protein [Candidatus Pacearchaeota archaeon]